MIYRLLSTAAITALALTGSLAHADATLDKIKQRGQVTIGVILSGPPFGTINPATQKPEGFNVDLAQAVATGLGVKLDAVQVQPSNRVQFLQSGKVDVLIANMSWTQERSEILDFAPTPFEEIGGALLTRKGGSFKQWDDVRGKTVCVSQGSNYTKPLIEEYGAKIKAFRGQPESLLALRGGGCDAAVHVSPTLRLMVATGSDWKDYELPLAQDLIPSPQVIWVRKGENDASAAIDRIIQQWHRSGWLIETVKKNGLSPSQSLFELQAKYRKTPS